MVTLLFLCHTARVLKMRMSDDPHVPMASVTCFFNNNKLGNASGEGGVDIPFEIQVTCWHGILLIAFRLTAMAKMCKSMQTRQT